MDLSNWRSQIRKGLIEFCILNIVSLKKEAYGLELIEGLKSAQLEVTEGTLYPLLSRLVKDEYLKPYWQTPDSGHPRKYYQLTSFGKKTLEEMTWEWQKLHQSINNLTQEKKNQKTVNNVKRRNLTC